MSAPWNHSMITPTEKWAKVAVEVPSSLERNGLGVLLREVEDWCEREMKGLYVSISTLKPEGVPMRVEFALPCDAVKFMLRWVG